MENAVSTSNGDIPSHVNQTNLPVWALHAGSGWSISQINPGLVYFCLGGIPFLGGSAYALDELIKWCELVVGYTWHSLTPHIPA